MRKLTWIIFIYFAMLIIPVDAGQYVIPASRVKESIQVRSKPDSNSALIDQLVVGQRVELLASIPYWYKIRMSPNKIGYVSKAWSEIQSDYIEYDAVNELTRSTVIVDVIDVGTGLAIWVHNNTFNLIYDGGTQDDHQSDDKNRFIKFIQYHNPKLEKIDHLIISHPHKDHLSLLPEIFRDYKVSNVWDSGASYDSCILYVVKTFWTGSSLS